MSALLETRGVTIRFGGLIANDDVSIEVPERAIVGLVGPNGAGKTTLFNALCGLLDPAHGTIHLDGSDITTWPPHRRAAAGIARTFQRLEVFGHMTVLEHLMLPHEVRSGKGTLFSDLLWLPSGRRAENEARERAREIAELVGVGAYLNRPARELPLGLNRLVELGRALATAPRIVLLDEPSSGMDTAETGRLAEVLRHVAGRSELTILLVEHDVGFVTSLCETIHVLDFGRVIASGTPREIQDSAAVREAYLGENYAAASSRGR